MVVRVGHIIHSLREGGAEHLLLTLAQTGPAVGVDMRVLSLMPTGGHRFAAQLRALGVPVASLDLRTRWDVRALPAAVGALRTMDVQILHTHLKHADLIGAYAKRRLGIPLVSTLHMIEDAPTGMKRVKRQLAARARVRLAERTITVSDAQRRWYLDTFPADPAGVTTVRNGILPPPVPDRQAVDRWREQLSVPPRSLLVSMVAIMRPGKGHEDLLAAVRRLPAQLDVCVVLAGDGPERARLARTVADDPSLSRRVRLPGFVDDVEGLLAASDLLAHPSHFDALPTAVMYAFAAGLPVVATDVGGIPEMVTPDVGVLVPAHDVGALTAALQALCDDPGRRAQLGAAARLRFEDEFEATVWARRLHRVYEEVLGSGRT